MRDAANKNLGQSGLQHFGLCQIVNAPGPEMNPMMQLMNAIITHSSGPSILHYRGYRTDNITQSSNKDRMKTEKWFRTALSSVHTGEKWPILATVAEFGDCMVD